ncbi:MAG: hypothetical protein WKF84_05190 [Pyrinomonadaceae bacterium]
MGRGINAPAGVYELACVSVCFIYYLPLIILVVALARWDALRLLTPRPQLLTRVSASLLIACVGMILFHPRE